MLATPVTNAPASPSSQGHLSHESLLETESADGVNVFARESKVFDVELEILLTGQAIVVPVQTVEPDGEPALVVDSVASTDADVASALRRVPPTEADVTSSVDSRSSPDIGSQLTKPTLVVGSGPTVTTPSYEDNGEAVPSHIPDAQGLASLKRTTAHTLEKSKLVIGKTPSANQSAQDTQKADVLTKSAVTSGGSDEGLEDLGQPQEPEVEQINRPHKSDSKVAVGVESTSRSPISLTDESTARDSTFSPTLPVEIASFQFTAAGNQHAPTTHSNSATTETSAFDVRSVSMSNQIVDHVLSARQSVQDGKVQLEVTLDPPDLGKITIELTEVDNQLSARLLVSENATLDAIRSSLPSMIDSLTDAGLSLDDLHLESSAGDNHASDGDAETGADASPQSQGPDRQGPASHWNGARAKGVDILA